MGKVLYIQLVSPVLGMPVLLEVAAAEPVGGAVLAAELHRRWPTVRWFWSDRNLEQVERLPLQGRILLGDAPMEPAAVRGSMSLRRGSSPVLVVLHGPDPGGSLHLRRGVYALGRGEVDLSIGDLQLSRRHALLRVSDTSIVLSDEGSANGVFFAHLPITERRILLGDTFTAGTSSFAVLPARGMPEGNPRWPPEPVVIDAAEPGSRLAMLLVGALAPLGLGVGLFLMTHSVFFLAFSAISLLTGGLPALMILSARKRFRRAWIAATLMDAARREDLAPPVGAVAAGLAGSSAVDTDRLPALVIGRGRGSAWLKTTGGADPPPPKISHRRGAKRRARIRRQDHVRRALVTDSSMAIEPGVLSDSPVLLRLPPGRGVWFKGTETTWGPVLRAAIVRWLPLLNSGALRLVVLGPAGFLPAEFLMLAGVKVVPTGASLPSSPLPTIVLCCWAAEMYQKSNDERAQMPSAGSSWLFCGGPDPGTEAEVLIDVAAQTVLLRSEGRAHNPWALGLPAPPGGGRPRSSASGRGRGITGTYSPAGPSSDASRSRDTSEQRNAGFDAELHLELERISMRALANAISLLLPSDLGTTPVTGLSIPTANTRDADSGQGVDGGVIREGIEEVPGIAHRLSAIIGDSEGGPVHLDMEADGPHLLIAGTTGSGKSELLRTLVLGFAAGTAPDELAFMLVDFKGGATLAPLSGLPHVQNIVTDLDAAAGERILELLGHELHRREKFLASYGATDWKDFHHTRTASDPPLPRLVVVIDEFRVFATELPEALERMVHIATVGRSLGVHLVLSTQRPAGIISAPLRANIGTVIALRTIGEFESNDLISTGAAARLDPGVPGMAYFRRGAGPAALFRARVNARPSVPAGVRAFGSNLGTELFSTALALNPGSAEDPADATGEELQLLVASIRARYKEVEPAVNPFSPALDATLARIPRSVARRVPLEQGIVGLLDRPALPQAEALVFDPAHTPRLMVCGLPGSGIERVPELLIHAANQRGFTIPAMLLDGNGTLESLGTHGSVGGYFGPGDSWRINELLLQLGNPACVGQVLLVVCGLGGWAQVLEANAFMRLEAFLTGFARMAPQLGRALVICGDRDLTGSRAASLCETRWYLPRGAGPEVLMGWPPLRKVSPHEGRGIVIAPQEPAKGVEFQLLDGPPDGNRATEPTPKLWIRNLELPDRLSSHELSRLESSSTLPPALAIGVCGPDNAAFIWSPGSCGIVIGREGAGKESLMNHLAMLGHSEAGHTVRFREEQQLPTDATEFLAGHPGVSRVLIERTDRRVSEASQAIQVLLGANLQVVLSAEPSARLLFELGLSAVVRDQRSFLVLDPQFGADADPSGFRLSPVVRSIRGRALVFDHGIIRQIQCVNQTPSVAG
jgi:S-DNA-T family DNA segregation ATPase FtsK/SpoIIIE